MPPLVRLPHPASSFRQAFSCWKRNWTKACNKTEIKEFSFIKYWPWRRLALLVEILANKFCPSAVVSALQTIWFYKKGIMKQRFRVGYWVFTLHISLWKLIKCFSPTLRRRNLKSNKQSPVLLDFCFRGQLEQRTCRDVSFHEKLRFRTVFRPREIQISSVWKAFLKSSVLETD